MRRLRVCIYGGTDLQGGRPEFISVLAYEILASIDSVIVTGGFRHSLKKPRAVSTDVAALRGAQRFVEENGGVLADYFEACVPEPALDSRPDVGGAVRLTEADGVSLRVMVGRTPLGRRLALVSGVDVVITIAGRRHTEVVIEQALELAIPVLPIPDAGGDSRLMLEKHRGRIASRFAPGGLDRCLGVLGGSITNGPERAAQAVVSLIRSARIGKCLVLLPYDDEHSELYAKAIEPAISKHMTPVRLDELPKSGVIQVSFADAIRQSSSVVADVTHLNENVMYEVGYAHGHGVEILLYTRDPARLDTLPLYFKTVNVRYAADTARLSAMIDEFLRDVKAGRGSQSFIT